MSSIKLTWKEDATAGAIPAYVYFSSDAQVSAPRPIALMFHAGGFVLGSASMVPRSQTAHLVARGFVLVTPEYRLCPQVSLYDGPIQDAKDVLKWCQEELPALLKKAKGVEVDSSRIVAMGHSAGGLLALTTGLCLHPPRAIVDFYGCKYLSDPCWAQKLPVFAQIPDQPDAHISKLYDGPQALTSLPMFIDGKPALSDPRCAWYIHQIKNGTSISSIVPDGDYERADATSQLTKDFPPTFFLHGKPDVFVDYKLTVRAHEELKKLGVETELVIGEEIGHAFDLQMLQETADPLFEKYVVPGLEFLARHV
ncbi:alpha beta-hydrolase [Clathrospora elynae]|uniref:Alpha beta-hydrolase n=1 Tax=Clathrospora elynae TaxID=706981 RepID=A0A6A5SXB1_9PLEO|nr:alpha beta-hydrolase [Clathrospora elynae]